MTSSDATDPQNAPAAAPYQVLARKYRPATFADLIGQEAMVRTLKNAFEADRIAQAFIMTGIRGTGKTTTARIIAKGLNCIGADGAGKATTDPCGQCDNCVAIAEGRHVDVMEMDAASRTGVNDIREIIESVHYRSASARYKIYIIDEVHMLSTSAFNALLKTLEEPPAHVKFIFATTEIRKVPVTVLSRCQRFDLRRIEPEVMIAHLARVAGLEGAQIAPDALALIARAAEGSVRDAISLLDQAIAHGAGETSADQVRAMLGLADRGRVLDLFEMIMRGDAAGALGEIGAQYADGADPLAILRDLADVTHWLSVIKITPDAANDPTISPEERIRGRNLAEGLSLRALARGWQMLLKSLDEVTHSPNAMMAAEMAIIRMTHVADLPSPDDLIRKLQADPPQRGGMGPSGGAPSGGGVQAHATQRASSMTQTGGPVALRAAPEPEDRLARFPSFDQVVALVEEMRDIKLLVELKTALRLVSYSPGHIEYEQTPRTPADLAGRLKQRLDQWTGAKWVVSVASAGGAPTIEERENAARKALETEAQDHPLMQAVLLAFPQARITAIRSHAAAAEAARAEALPEMAEDAIGDDWDPFEDD